MADNALMEETPPKWFFQYMEQKEKEKEEEIRRIQAKHEEELRTLREDNQKRSTNGEKPGKALPALQEYYGEPEKLDSWLHQAQVKLTVDYAHCSEYVKFWALAACLRGKAMKRMDAWTRQFGTSEDAHSNNFFRQMKFVFQDPQAIERAQRKLDSIRQGQRPFLEAYMEWQSLLIEAGGANWPDNAKKMSLNRILSDELSRAMITVSTGEDFESYCNKLKEVDDRLRAYKLRRGPSFWRKSEQEPSAFGTNQRGRKPDEMDWEPQPPVQVTATRQKRVKWVSKEEIDRRFQDGLCGRCGASGHWKTTCPYAPPRRPVPVSPTKALTRQARAVVEPQLEDEEPDYSEPEK